MMRNFSYVRVRSLKEAIEHLSSDGARLYAGGTDLLGCLRDHVFEAEKVVSIAGLKQLRGIHETADGALRIGALTTISDVARNTTIRERYRVLAQAAFEVASPQLRSQGTIGGNICQKPRCWYYRGEFHCLRKGGEQCFAVDGENQYHCIFGGENCYMVHPSDMAPALMALGARVSISGPTGTRTVSMDDFYVHAGQDVEKETILRSDEIVTDIFLPPAARGLRGGYRKVRARRSWDFALGGMAIALRFGDDRITEARVVLSGAAPVPWRSREAEQAIIGKRLDKETVSRASDAVVRNAQPLEKNAYKIPLFRGIMEEELLAI
jgi:xanthine dehydrogenase YagS FAD-binding subunit